jgi:transcriptional regulator with XRE-family HTH domain
MQNKPSTQETLVSNLKRLMDMCEWDAKELEKRSGVTSRMIRYILGMDRCPSIEVAEKLANAFGLTGWQLIMPQLMGDIKQMRHIEALIDNWNKADPDGKLFIEDAAKREAGRKVSNGDNHAH